MAKTQRTPDEEKEYLETLAPNSSTEELADSEMDSKKVREVKAILRGEKSPHAKEWADNWTHLNIRDEKGDVVFLHPRYLQWANDNWDKLSENEQREVLQFEASQQ